VTSDVKRTAIEIQPRQLRTGPQGESLFRVRGVAPFRHPTTSKQLSVFPCRAYGLALFDPHFRAAGCTSRGPSKSSGTFSHKMHACCERALFIFLPCLSETPSLLSYPPFSRWLRTVGTGDRAGQLRGWVSWSIYQASTPCGCPKYKYLSTNQLTKADWYYE
jgi:hypothetical protein